MKRLVLFSLCLFLFNTYFIVPVITSTNEVQASVAVIRKPAQELIEAIGRYVARKGGKEIGEELTRVGGEATVRRIAERALREGGEDTLSALARNVSAHGPEALRAADNAVNLPRLMKSLDELPKGMTPQAIRRLAAGAEGKALAETVERFGAKALRAEVLHPGVGGRLVGELGEAGITIASRASRDQAIMISRHASDITKLPTSQKNGILKMMHDDFERMVKFIGRFTEKNPGKTLFTISATTIILANSDKALGDGEIVFDSDGNPSFLPKPGFIERTLSDSIRALLVPLLPVVALIAFLWMGIKLWFYYKLKRLEFHINSSELENKCLK